jgi:hypothetical protein
VIAQLEIYEQLKVTNLPAFPNQEGVFLGPLRLCCLTYNATILNTPKSWVSVPTLQGFAIKQRMKVIAGFREKTMTSGTDTQD